jgi:hypothetical protein
VPRVEVRTVGVALVGAAILAAVTITPANGVTPRCRLAWRSVAAPIPATGTVADVVAVSTADAWVVGTIDDRLTLVEHWDGRRWRIVPSPSGVSKKNKLEAVTAGPANDIWAVGTRGPSKEAVAGEKTLIEHWDGRAWKIVPSPNPKADASELQAVTAISASDVWAVGRQAKPDRWEPLIEHWNGTRWSIVRVPTGEGELFGVAGVAANDVWAVGSGFDSTGSVLAEHWDGRAWRIVRAPPFASPHRKFSASLYAISADASNDVWAVGDRAAESLVDHWNGRNWSPATHILLSDVGSGEPALRGVVALSPSDVWIGGNNGESGLREHWDGKRWSAVRSPLSRFGAVSSREIWALGGSTGIQHYACL